MITNRPEHDYDLPGYAQKREPVVYLRGSLAEEAEHRAADKHFKVVEHRTAIPRGSLVIPRYSALPYYRELEQDMETMGCKLTNTYREHSYVAHLSNWYHDLEDVTPKTWFALDQCPEEGPFVVKGSTNSRKFEWDTHMFARNRREAVEVASRLLGDSMIGEQSIVIREYVPLTKLADGLRGLQICEEYRFFVLHGDIVDAGFYWSSHTDDLDREYNPAAEVPMSFLLPIIERIAPNIPFFVIDVARKADGGWTVIELNDGQQSGLSTIDPDRFYKRLREAVQIHYGDVECRT